MKYICFLFLLFSQTAGAHWSWEDVRRVFGIKTQEEKQQQLIRIQQQRQQQLDDQLNELTSRLDEEGVNLERVFQRIKFLIRKGADPNNTYNFTYKIEGTVLHAVIYAKQDLDMVKFLIEVGGADPNIPGRTALHYAIVCPYNLFPCRGSSPALIKYLISKTTRMNINNSRGFNGYSETILHSAIRGHLDLEIIKLLFQAGANPNVDNRAGLTPLHLALWYKKERDPNPSEKLPEETLALINLLLSAGADIHARPIRAGFFEQTALQIAVRIKNHPSVIQALIDGGADVQFKDRRGRTAMDLAKEVKSDEQTMSILQQALL